MKARKGQFCTIHHSYFCCGREAPKLRGPRQAARYAPPKSSKWDQVKPGVWHIPDPTHPRGYRVRLSKVRMEQLLLQKIQEQDGLCSICQKPLIDLRDVTPDHKEPTCMNAARRDEHESNIGAAHKRCNFEKGSKRIAA